MSNVLPGSVGASVIAITAWVLAGPWAGAATSTDVVTDAVGVVAAPAVISWATGGHDPACDPPPPDCQPDSPDPTCQPAPPPAHCHSRYVPVVPVL